MRTFKLEPQPGKLDRTGFQSSSIKLFRPTRSRVAKTRLELLVRVIMV